MFGSSLTNPLNLSITQPAQQQNSLATTNTTSLSNSKDWEVPSPPEDTVSSLKFRPNNAANGSNTNMHLHSASWDGLLRVWEISVGGNVAGGLSCSPKVEQKMPAPVLDSDWSTDGTKIFAGCGDNKGIAWDLVTNQVQQFAQHNNPIRTVNYVQTSYGSFVITGGWDKVLRFWDLRSANAATTINMSDRVLTSAVRGTVGVFACGDRQISILSLDGQPKEYQRNESPLKYQSTAVALFLDKQKVNPAGYALGCIEGRVAIQYINAPNPKDNFTFKCHRSTVTSQNTQDIYPVNAISFHPTHNTLVTAGSDGRFTFWDKDAQTKLKMSEQMDQPITRCNIDPTGNLFAYALGYDWHKGYENNFTATKKPKIFLHACLETMRPNVKK